MAGTQGVSHNRGETALSYNHPDLDVPSRVSYFHRAPTPRVVYPRLLSSSLTLLYRFWGALSNSPKYTPNLTAWFINRDGARIGNTIWESFSNKSAPGLHLGWVLVKPAAAGTDQQIMDAIVQERAWVAVVSKLLLLFITSESRPLTWLLLVEANATTRLSNARANGDANYDPTSAITMYYAQARLSLFIVRACTDHVFPIPKL